MIPLPEPAAWRIFDGEGQYNYSDDEPELFSVDWAARYGRKHETLFTAEQLTSYAAAAVAAEREKCREIVEEFIRTQSHTACNAREALSEVSARIYKRGSAA